MLSLTRPKIGVSETCRAQPSRTVRREKQPRPRKLPEVVSTERRKGLVEDTSLQEWLEALDSLIAREGREAVGALLQKLHQHAEIEGVDLPFSANTPYVNTIPVDAQPPYPGDRELERANKSIIRWNAMAMVVRANRESDGIGGHISTYASAATLYEVGFNHFFRARNGDYGGDQVYFQGHAAPGIYARAFLEGRLTQEQLNHFRRELRPGGGLSSYPHPWLQPDFWEFPTVSMGLGPIMGIYQARFNRYLENRGLKPRNGGKVWCFLGDGECDEPETLGAITLASRERLDNLVFVVNCNLQRLDGPVRGNGKIIQELEAAFRGAGWNVIKVIWGSDWDPIFANDADNVLVKAMGEAVDGLFQKFSVESGEFIRQTLRAIDPRIAQLVAHLNDEQLRKLKRGGHDPAKVYAAYRAAVHHEGAPTVILAKTVKGYGLGESGEGKNITHQQKKLNEDELREFRSRFGIPISDEQVAYAPFYRPPEDGPNMRYLRERREALGGYIPARTVHAATLAPPPERLFAEFRAGNERPVSTTMVFVRILAHLLRDKELGKYIVPIVPDEARTFGMDGLFRQIGIYSSIGQVYEPVDADNVLYYKEATDGQILEEGITEAGSMSSFIAAGTAYATHGIPMIPFFIYYSMFGLQRVGDLVWAAGDMRCKGFLIGGTAGRTTLAGEGLQHQDGHSHVLAMTVPNLKAYDAAFAFELAAIVRDGIRRMYQEREDVFYYLTVGNENYPMPPMPDGDAVEDGILRGMYKFRASPRKDLPLRAQLLGSGAIMNETLKAQAMLEQYGVAADCWSVTSYKELRNDALDADRHNLLHPDGQRRIPYVTQCLRNEEGVVVAASDYMKLLPDGLARWVPHRMVSLGTDGFGRSESRESLRTHFEVDARFITAAALSALAQEGQLAPEAVARAFAGLEIDPDKVNPRTA
ncbi:MAG: pyruvate dehydrogenase (acetyl-transferring), homodimeric type [Candidatus Hydrogenedentes bacterium]|nr:pyruvate dehydrogenase (acetyl-transferring), homodimeric type [Candidatus Hydrogenedentota bacterium]